MEKIIIQTTDPSTQPKKHICLHSWLIPSAHSGKDFWKSIIVYFTRFLFSFLFLFCNTRIWTQGFVFAGQELYCLSHTSSPQQISWYINASITEQILEKQLCSQPNLQLKSACIGTSEMKWPLRSQPIAKWSLDLRSLHSQDSCPTQIVKFFHSGISFTTIRSIIVCFWHFIFYIKILLKFFIKVHKTYGCLKTVLNCFSAWWPLCPCKFLE
jgi:hypothetical protein